MIVLDASAATELVLGMPGALLVADRVSDPDETLHAPHLLLIEAVQAIRRQATQPSVTEERAAAAIADLASLDLILHDHGDLLGRVWELRSNLSAYDAAYVALAEVLDAPLVTLDARIAGAPGHDATVEVLSSV